MECKQSTVQNNALIETASCNDPPKLIEPETFEVRPIVFHVFQPWLKSERDLGCRPDGASLHLTESDRIAYEKEYRANVPKGAAPDEYSLPDGPPRIVDINTGSELYKQLVASKNGIRLWQCEAREFLEETAK